MRKSIFILLFALLGMLSARAYDFEVDGIYYGRIPGTTDQVGVTCKAPYSERSDYSGSVVIPSTVEYGDKTYTVTIIGPSAFQNCSGLTSVTIGESVTSIGPSAFQNCSGLTSVTIGESVTSIGPRAFQNCSGLTSVTIGESVTSIGPRAFQNCSGLTSVTIPESVSLIGDYAFYGCRSLTSVTIPESVSLIGDYAFTGTAISAPLYSSKVFAYMPKDYSGEYTIPSGIQSIAGGAFYGCRGLTSVTIPEGVSYIGESAFEDCRGLTSVTIPESVDTIGTGAFYGTSISRPLYNSKVFAYLPQDYSGEYSVPSGIQLIAGAAFLECTALTSVTIPNSVTSIEYVAFYGCSGLTSVTIPESVTSIGEDAFQYCRGLTSVTIPEGVTSIGRRAFSSCTGLTSVEWNAVVCQNEGGDGDYRPFYNCENITSITFGNQVECIPAYLCYRMNKLTSVTIPNSVTSIGYQAFYGCSGLTSVTIGESVTSIGYQAFYGCSGLTAVEWNAVACQDFSSSNLPFPNGENITSITFGKQVERLPAYLCLGRNKLTSVTIPNSVTSIGSSAFSGCSDLTSVTIGKRVDSIGKDAFYGCNRILSVTSLSKTPPRCGDPVFSFYEGTLFVPRGCRITYLTAQEWYKFSRIEELTSAGTATVTVRPNDASMGTVIGGGEYELDEQVTLVAIPNEGHHFVKWDDGKAANPRLLTVTEDTTIIAIFAKDGNSPDNPDDPDTPTPNENLEADHFRIYAQDRTIHLSEDRGLVQVYNMAGRCVYNGRATAIPVSQSGVYIVAVGSQRFKVLVR